jgi:hypothetical protein
MIFPTKVNGIPCQVKVTHYMPGIPAHVMGPPEDCYEAEPEEFEFELLDRRGRSATWLDRYLTPDVIERIAEEHHDMARAEFFEPCYD